MKDKRPINLDLMKIKFPIMAIVSILHRVSGVATFLFIPALLWILSKSLHSAEDFNLLMLNLSDPMLVFGLWVFLSVFIYHFVAGIRHLLMDLGIGETLNGGRRGSWSVIIISLILIFAAGCWLWG